MSLEQQHEHEHEHRQDVAPYVLGALEPDEIRRFERHLQECSVCREEVQLLQAPVDELARAVPQRGMPEGLRARILDQVRSEAELLQAAGAGADRPQPRRSRRTRRLTAFGTALAAACGVAAGALVIGGGQTLHQQTINAYVASAPGARAELIRAGTRAELVVNGLPQPPQGHIYQVWLAHGKAEPQPTDALFSVDGRGRASVDVPGIRRGVDRVMVTAEPMGGSRHPTSLPIIVAPV